MTRKFLKVAGLIILAAALTAPLASAMRIDPGSPVAISGDAVGVNGIDVCTNGTMPGPTGGDNNNYDYYGNPCNTPTTIAARLPVIGQNGNSNRKGLGRNANALYALACANGTMPGPTGGDNNNYDYYGDPCDS